MSNFGSYSGEEFFNLELKKRDWLIRQIARIGDSVLIVGGEKSGKSILVKQLTCSLTSGTQPFLDEYVVEKACKVTYIQLEGELIDTRDRYEAMRSELDFNPDNFNIIFSEPINLQDENALKGLVELIESKHTPDVVIIDPIYFALNGSLSDDEGVRKFLGNIRRLKDHFGCTIILVHHTRKLKFDAKGEVIQDGDEATFGSASLKWWPDHIILFRRDPKTEVRYFTCVTQRSGDIVKELSLKLVQPFPLYFAKTDVQYQAGSRSNTIYKLLEAKGRSLSALEIMDELCIAKSTFYKSIKGLLRERLVARKSGTRPVTYELVQS